MKSFTCFIKVVCSIFLLQAISFVSFSQVKTITFDPKNPSQESTKEYDTVFVEQPDGNIVMKIVEHIPIKLQFKGNVTEPIHTSNEPRILPDTVYIEQADETIIMVILGENSTSIKYTTVNEKKPNGAELNEVEIMKFIYDNIKYPPEDVKNKIEGRVIIHIKINEKGELVGYKILKNLTGSKTLEAEAIRVVKLLPRLKPHLYKNYHQNVTYSLPIEFSLKKK